MGGGRYAIVAACPGVPGVEDKIARMVAAWAAVADAHVGLVSVDNAAVTAVAEQETTRLAEVALERALARREDDGERIERFAIGRAAPSREEKLPSPDYEARNGV